MGKYCVVRAGGIVWLFSLFISLSLFSISFSHTHTFRHAHTVTKYLSLPLFLLSYSSHFLYFIFVFLFLQFLFSLFRYQGRRLQWAHAHQRCVLTARFPKGKKELEVSLFQVRREKWMREEKGRTMANV